MKSQVDGLMNSDKEVCAFFIYIYCYFFVFLLSSYRFVVVWTKSLTGTFLLGD